MTWPIVLLAGALLGFLGRHVVGVIVEYLERPAREMPGSALRERTAPTSPRPIRTKRCPGGFSAAQILGYHDGGGRRHEPVYPGGLDAWTERHK